MDERLYGPRYGALVAFLIVLLIVSALSEMVS
jgi:hypothetical protein